jgi:hypothetical protein
LEQISRVALGAAGWDEKDECDEDRQVRPSHGRLLEGVEVCRERRRSAAGRRCRVLAGEKVASAAAVRRRGELCKLPPNEKGPRGVLL